MPVLLKRRTASLLSLLMLRTPFWRRSVLHRLARLFVFAAYGYLGVMLGVMLVILALENRLLFYPVTAAEDWEPPPPELRVDDVEFTSRDGTRLHAWWATPRGWEPSQGALLYCYGNAGNLSYRGEPVRRWRDALHTAVLIFDYPGYGKSGGRPSEAGCYAAADAAYDWLTQAQQVPGERVLLYGASLGGAVATDLAARRPHRGLILMSTFSSLPDMAQQTLPWLPARWMVRNRFDTLVKLGTCCQPVFIAHGTADGMVPFAHGQRLFAAAREPKHFCPLVGHGHNDPPGPDFYEAVREFLARVEAAPKSAGAG
jgi:fermentation-respiration switch protein FrsA (DUF1100 family)